MSQYSVKYGKKTIDFTLERRQRKTLGISVHPDLSVVATAPINTGIKDILKRVKKRASWILKQQEYFKNFRPLEPPREYVSGETHRYLGRQYRLKVIQADKNEVKLKGGFIYVYSRRKTDSDYNAKLVYRWYKDRAGKRFNVTLKKCLDKLRKYEVNEPTVAIKKMKSRWGSCVPKKNKILLNTTLVKAPSHCVEYVIMHELCHLKYPNHNNGFYEFLAIVMPDWEMRKERLEEVTLSW